MNNREIKSLFNNKSKHYLGRCIKEKYQTDLVFERHRLFSDENTNNKKHLSVYEVDVIKNLLNMWCDYLEKTGNRYHNVIDISKDVQVDFGLSSSLDKDDRYKIYIGLKTI